MISEHAIWSCWIQAGTRGWKLFQGGSLADGWHAMYGGQLFDYDVYLDVDGDWVYMQCPILQGDASPQCKAALTDYLLRLNDRIFWAKFTLFHAEPDQSHCEDWVALTVECPAEVFDAGTFRLMTESIATYAEQYDREIRAIALDKNVADLVQRAEWE